MHPDHGHLDPDHLALLALGDHDLTAGEQTHLGSCHDCTQALADFHTVATIGRETNGLRDLPLPPPPVWDAIADQVDGAHRTVAPTRPQAVSRRRSLVLALSAALIAVAVTLGVTTASHTRPRIQSTAALTALPAAPTAAHGTAQLVRVGATTQLRITLSGMPNPAGYYEAWLFDPTTGTMYPMGPLTPAGGTVLVTGINLDHYTGVDISAQPLDGTGRHGQSMLHGTLRA